MQRGSSSRCTQVDSDEVVDYYEIVHYPMDFTTMLDKIDTRQYTWCGWRGVGMLRRAIAVMRCGVRVAASRSSTLTRSPST
jgi:hypothetical protein